MDTTIYDPFSNAVRRRGPAAGGDPLEPGARRMVTDTLNARAAAAKRDPLDDEIRDINERRTNLRLVRESVKNQTDDFLAREGADLFEGDPLTGKPIKNPDGTLVPKLGAEVEGLRAKANQRTGLIAGALSPSRQQGDPTPDALAAQRRLAEIEPTYRLKQQKYERLKAEEARIDEADKAHEARLGELGRQREARYTVTPQDVASAVTSVNASRAALGQRPVAVEDVNAPAPKGPQRTLADFDTPNVRRQMAENRFETVLPPTQEAKFQQWKLQAAPNDSGEDYDLRGAFLAGASPDKNGHWPDTYKKPNHPTFSNESIYAKGRAAGRWSGEVFTPPDTGYPKGVFTTLNDTRTGQPVGRAIAPEAVQIKSRQEAAARKLDPAGAELVELSTLRDQGVTMVGNRPIVELLAERGGDEAVATVRTLESVKKINARLAQIDGDLKQAGQKRVGPLERERAILSKLLEQKQGLIDAIPTVDRIKSALGSVVGSLAELPAGTMDFVAATAKKIDQQLPAFLQTYEDKATEDLQSAIFAKEIRDFAQKIAPTDPRLAEEFWSAQVPGAIGSMLGFLGPAAVTKSKYITPLVIGTTTGGGQGYRDAIAHGATEEQAFNSLLLNAGVGASEIVPISRMIDRLDKGTGGGIKRALINAGKEGFEETVQEFFQTTAGNAIAQSLYDENRELFEGSGTAAGVGGVTGVLMSAVVSALPGKQHGGPTATPSATPVPAPGAATSPVSATQPQPEGGASNESQEKGRAQVLTPPGSTPPAVGQETAPAAPAVSTPEPVEEPEVTLDDQAPKSFRFTNAKGEALDVEAKRESQAIAKVPDAFGPVTGMKRVERPAEAVAGEKINREWNAFSPESKSLGIPRAEMPQVKAEHRGALTQFLKARDITSEETEVRPSELKPTQAEFSPAKVQKAREFTGGDRAILVSSDNHVVDGHHQWMAKLTDKPDEAMRVIRLDAPIRDVLAQMKEFPSVENAGGATAAAQPAQPISPEPSANSPLTPQPVEKVTAPPAPATPSLVKPPAVARGKNKPATFISTVAKASGLKAKDKATRFLTDFAPRLHRANPTAFQAMEVHVLNQAEWDAHPRVGAETPDSSAAYNPTENTLYLNSDKMKGPDGVDAISAIVHESGHFAEQFALGESMTQREWEKLTHDQRRAAWREYAGADFDGDAVRLIKDRRARAEWVAMQFARVVRGETDAMPKGVVEKLKAFLETVRELVRKWVGAKSLTTAELDSWILDKLGYASREAETKAAAPGATASPSAPAPETKAKRAISPELQALGESLFGTPSGEGYRKKFDANTVEAANKFVSLLVREHPNVRSRAALARFISENFPKAKPYSEAVFRIMGGFVDLDESYSFEESYAEPTATPAQTPVAGPAAATATYGEKAAAAAKEIQNAIQFDRVLSWRDLFAITDKAFGGTQAAGAYTVKDAYDAMELAMNKWLADGEGDTAYDSPAVIAAAVKVLKDASNTLPTQTKRTAEQDAMQQFSTPPPLAFIANWVANLRPTDVYLEPSAGTGGLLAFARATGVKTIIANELSERRNDILREGDIADTVLQFNGEHLSALLDPRFKSGALERPTVVVMNPPFSNGAESGKRKDTMVGAKHVEEGLKTLAPGGRLVAIVGDGMSLDSPTFRAWWKAIRERYNVKANIAVNGAEYSKYGTTFDNRLLVIDNDGPTTGEPVRGNVDKYADLPKVLEAIRHGRPQGQRPDAGRVEQTPAQPGGADGAQTGESDKAAVAARPDAGARPRRSRTGDGERAGSAAPVAEPVGGQSSVSTARAPDAAESAAPAGASGGDGAGNGGADRERTGPGSDNPGSGLAVTRQDAQAAKPVDDDAVFSEYSPSKVKVAGAIPHPTPLVESAAMAAVPPPDPHYTPNLPKEVVADGKLSDAQLENVVYAGQAHEKFLPNGERRGYFIGDGTGVGKGRQIAAVIMDNWRRGRKRAVWISKSGGLVDDARRDLRDLGMKDDAIVPINKAAMAGTGTIKLAEGIVFSTYTSLAKDHEGLDPAGKVRRKKPDKKNRIEQLAEWLGKDFDGVIAFDEAHMAGNAVAVKTNRGMKDPSNTGIAVVDLQKMLPKARILYVSATGATEVTNLSYADRLGIWGPRTPFPNKLDFFNKISAGGVSAMEIVARDLKALGGYLARTLSFKGVQFEQLQQTLTPDQLDIYNAIADSWALVFQNLDKVMADTNANKSSHARMAARSAFFGAQQRFFNQLLTAMEMPAVIKGVREALDAGNSAVLQLVNTNEATQDREIARATTEESADLEDLDLSPKDILLQYVDKSFPTTLYKEVVDPNNAERTMWVPVTDEAGNPVADPAALAKKEELLTKIATLKIPENPLESVLNAFGHDAVAEITGRGQRIVTKLKPDGSTGRVLEANRTDAKRKVEAQEFQDGKRRILVFSGAGGTGFSYHASRKAKNQQLRVHFLVQAGWRADAAIQGLGRTHRSDQAQPPRYNLVTTDIQGHKRFISTIARRLAQLGALTAGERKSTGQGLFSEKDNLESNYANDALVRFFHDLYGGRIEGITFGELTKQMGFGYTKSNGLDSAWVSSLIDVKTGALAQDKLPTIQQFLNRLLALRVDQQNAVFEAFGERLEKRIENAKADGTYDPGAQTYRAAEINKVADEVVYKHPDSTAETRIVEIEAKDPVRFTAFDEIASFGGPVERYVRNIKSGRVYALKEAPPRTMESGAVVETFRRVPTHGGTEIQPRDDFSGDKYETLRAPEAQAAWEAEIAGADKTRTRTEHFIVGSFLPIWDRIKIESPKIYRITTSAGESMLGAMIPPKQVDGVKRRLGAKTTDKTPAQVIKAIIEDGQNFELANGWKVKRVTVSGDKRIEVTGLAYQDVRDFTGDIGGFTERIGYTTRFFMPTGSGGAEAMERLLQKSPVAGDAAPDAEGETMGTPPVKGTAAQEAVLAKVNGTLEDNRTLVQRLRDYLADLREYVATELQQKLVDSFAAIKRLERATFGGANLDASVSAYKAARLSKNLPSVMDYLMNHGTLEYRNGSMAMRAGGKGLMPIFQPLIDAGTLRLWEGYATATRANRLLQEGKETNFGRTFNQATGQWSWDPATAQREIDELLALGQQYPEFETVRKEYVAFQTSILDVAEAAGLINPDARALWEKSDYVPFYRITETLDGAKGPRKRRGIASQRSGIRQLKGGAAPVAIMENIVRNVESLVDASFKNIAMQRVADLAAGNTDLLVRIPFKAVPLKASIAEVLQQLEKAGVDTSGLSTAEAEEFVKFWRMRAPQGKDVVSVMVDGKPIYYRVKDAPLLRSVQSMGPRAHAWWMKALMLPKTALTNLVTLDPAFMAANTIRDSFSAWVIADTPIKPGLDTATGFVKSLRNDPSKLAVMAAGGGTGSYLNLRDGRVRDNIRTLTPAQRKSFLESILDTPKKVGRAYADIGRATENANRIAIADSVRKRGGSEAEAAFQALDIMDFGLRGDSAALNFFLDTVPFMNARIQGLYRLGRGLKENPKRVATHGAVIMGATLALLAANWDDERYWALPEWERDVYYHFWVGEQHLRVPKPFEVGQIFSTIPERILEYLGQTGDGKLLARRMLTMIADTFAMNPTPQAIKAPLERAMNLNTFTGAPIISRGDEFKQPEQQFNMMTSETLRELAEAMPDSAPAWMRSPKTLEHLTRGYFGSLGMYALTGADAITRAAGDYPEEPEGQPGDWWVMKRFAPSSDTRETKYVSQFFELNREITGLVRQIKELQKTDPAAARRVQAENADLVRFAPTADATNDLMQSLRKEERAIYDGPGTPEEKRRRLGNLVNRRNQVAERTMLASPRRPTPIFNPFR